MCRNYRLITGLLLAFSTMFSIGSAEEKIPTEIFGNISNIMGLSLTSNGEAYAVAMMHGSSPAVYIHPTPKRSSFDIQQYLLPESLLSFIDWIDNDKLIVSYTLIIKNKRGKKKNFVREWVIIDREARSRKVLLSYKINLLVANGSDDLLHALPQDPDHILVAFTENKKYYPAIFKVNIKNGVAEKVVSAQEPITNWVVDTEGLPIFGYGTDGEKSSLLVRDKESGKMIDISNQPLFKTGYFEPMSQGITDASMYVSSSIGQGRRKIYHYYPRCLNTRVLM